MDTFASNPQFRIRVEDPDDDDEDNLCTVIISLMQKGRRALRDEGLDTLTIGRFVLLNAKRHLNLTMRLIYTSLSVLNSNDVF